LEEPAGNAQMARISVDCSRHLQGDVFASGACDGAKLSRTIPQVWDGRAYERKTSAYNTIDRR